MEIEGTVVTLTLTCASDYAAIEFYERVCASARDGAVQITFNGRPGSP